MQTETKENTKLNSIKLFFKKLRGNPKARKIIKWLIILAIAVVVVIKVRSNLKTKINPVQEVTTTTMVTRDLEKSLTGSGVIEPQDQYSVIPLVQGEILDAPFEEGQQVKKGDLLYQIDTENVQNTIKSTQLSVKQAQNAYETAQKALDDLKLTSQVTGYVQSLKVKSGDQVTMGMEIAEVYDNTSMYLTIPFNEEDIKNSWIGKKATIYAGDNAEKIYGTVTEISPVTEVLTGGRIVRQVKVLVKNPGGLTKGMTATATIQNEDCNSPGIFDVKEQTILVASGTGKITTLNLENGQYISRGQTYAYLDGDTVAAQIRDAKTALESAELNLQTQKNSLKDYSITAPISGQIITKKKKKGDTINASTASADGGLEMAVIYDLSSLKFEMKVDELDIESIKIGQKVQVTSDVFPDTKLTGKVENISLKSINQNSVTQYPVLIRLDKKGKLLPGMNVEGKIVTASAKQVNCIPVECLMDGNLVYVKDTSTNTDGTTGKTKKADKSTTNTDTSTDTSTSTNVQNTSASDTIATNSADDTSQTSSPMTAPADLPTGFKVVPVEIGISDGNYIEIISGLNPEDQIYYPSAPTSSIFMMGEPSGAIESSGAVEE